MSSGICCAAITKHCDGKGKRCVDESFEARHPDAAQAKSAKPRQRIQIRGQAGSDFLCAHVHPAGDTNATMIRCCRVISLRGREL